MFVESLAQKGAALLSSKFRPFLNIIFRKRCRICRLRRELYLLKKLLNRSNTSLRDRGDSDEAFATIGDLLAQKGAELSAVKVWPLLNIIDDF